VPFVLQQQHDGRAFFVEDQFTALSFAGFQKVQN
jgi:hypothetical protein